MKKTLRLYLIPSLALLMLLAGLLELVGQRPDLAHAAQVCPSNGGMRGVDVSHFNGSIDWTQVANVGISFGYARVSDGTLSDPAFQTNFAAMQSAGVKRGALLSFRPGSDPVAQAHTLISSLSQAGFTFGDLIPAIDIEVTDGQSPATIVSNLQTLVHTIQSAIGVSPVILTAPGFWNSAAGGSTAFAGNPLWVANWLVNCPTIPSVFRLI